MIPQSLFRVVGVRADGSRRVLADAMPESTARQVLHTMPEHVFAEIVIEPYSPDTEPTSEGHRSVELFPENVQRQSSGESPR